MRPTKREQRQARRALLRQLITVGFAVVVAVVIAPPAGRPETGVRPG
jgi:hypothetical protein